MTFSHALELVFLLNIFGYEISGKRKPLPKREFVLPCFEDKNYIFELLDRVVLDWSDRRVRQAVERATVQHDGGTEHVQ